MRHGKVAGRRSSFAATISIILDTLNKMLFQAMAAPAQVLPDKNMLEPIQEADLGNIAASTSRVITYQQQTGTSRFPYLRDFKRSRM